MKKILLCLFLINTVYAEDISIVATVDKDVVEINDCILLKVTVTGSATIPLTVPQINDFVVYSLGQNQSSNFSIINGKISSSVSLIYNYNLTPKAVGKFIIPPFSVQDKGKIYKTNQINIEVVKTSSGQTQTQSRQMPKTRITSSDDIFIKVSVNKDKIYVNEPVTMTFGFYKRVRIFGQPEYRPPDTSGFWAEDLPPQRTFWTTVSNREYELTEIKTALFPISPGEYKVGEAFLKCSVEDFDSDTSDFFRSFFSTGRQISLKSEPIKITVLPLPQEGKPDDFVGSVGIYNITSEIDKKDIKTGEPATLTVTVFGKGNIKSILDPAIYLPENEFKKYETVSNLNINKDNYEVKGSKVFKTVIVPKKAGSLTIPSIKYTFFDYAAKKYRTVNTIPISLHVKQGPREESVSQLVSVLPEGVKILGKDIRFIKQSTNFNFSKKLFYKEPLFIILNILPLLSLLVLWQILSFKRRMEKNVVGLRASRAYSKAMKGLKSINKLINIDKIDESYASIENVLMEYIASKTAKQAAGLTREEIKTALHPKVDGILLNKVYEIIEQSHFMRFAHSKYKSKDLLRFIESVKNLIAKLEKSGL